MVSDARASAKWYEEKLKFDVARDGHWVTAGRSGASWRLHICEGNLDPGITGVTFYIENLQRRSLG